MKVGGRGGGGGGGNETQWNDNNALFTSKHIYQTLGVIEKGQKKFLLFCLNCNPKIQLSSQRDALYFYCYSPS